ncbi:MAG: NADH:ubiquinone reductase (Na(+)-transporting) subunit A, partial [Flavobacterium sp.]|nr:NADH:ubiquinone reductase (Na(+)-transporting) subunit A [Flavobacterium sp.]
MSGTIKIRKGLNIKLLGEADKTLTAVTTRSCAVKPTDFIGVFPKMLVKPGAEVKAGSPLFFNKYSEKVIFTSPVSGIVSEIVGGEKRVIQEIRINCDTENTYEDFGIANPNTLTRDEIIEKILKSGVWPYIRQRPFSIIANPDQTPKSIHVSAFDSAPLACDLDFMVHSKGDEFQAGIDALKNLTTGKVHLNVHETNTTSKVFLNSQNCQINKFSGPHPAGNVGIQIHHIEPINKGDLIWYLSPQAVLIIGRLFLHGKYDATKIVALAGSEVKNPRYFKLNS